MSAPKHVTGYEAEWMQIAQLLAQNGEVLLPIGDAKLAREYRLKFYGFRRAMTNHDAANPWLGALMESRATITAEGHLRLQRGVLGALLRGLLEHTHIQAPNAAEVVDTAPTPPPGPSMPASEQFLLDYLSKKD